MGLPRRGLSSEFVLFAEVDLHVKALFQTDFDGLNFKDPGATIQAGRWW